MLDNKLIAWSFGGLLTVVEFVEQGFYCLVPEAPLNRGAEGIKFSFMTATQETQFVHNPPPPLLRLNDLSQI